VLGTLPGNGLGASLLHLTTHGTLTPEPAVHTRDGWLPLADVLDRARGHAPGGLVITRACLTDTALVGHDESLILASAFLTAGATAVIGTRWPVENGAETALSIRLRGHFRDGCDPAEALRRAQLDLLRPDGALRESLGPHLAPVDDAELSDPACWAGHVHHGT
jgi:CHAT domain-containing protein